MTVREKIRAGSAFAVLVLLAAAAFGVGAGRARGPTVAALATSSPTPAPTPAPTSDALPGQPVCYFRATYRDNPWTLEDRWCLEQVISDESGGLLGFTALATAPDGTLYAARPLTGQVFALTDTNGDDLPDRPRLVADGLTLPNSLDYAGGALYIAGGAHVYRLRDGALETLVDDLPSGPGFWTGGVAVGPDGRLYVSTGAPCDACATDDPARGAILSYALDGGDRRLEATGLREPADIAFAGGTLWTVDSARDGLPHGGEFDELNRLTSGANFGFPFCIGVEGRRDLTGGPDCASVVAPALVFPTHSHPIGIAAYRGDAFPRLGNTLLVALGGTVNQAFMQGYALVAVPLDEQGRPHDPYVLIPAQDPNDKPQQFTLQEYNYRTSGFWPRRPLDVTVTDRGWIYVSVGDGLILVLRPL